MRPRRLHVLIVDSAVDRHIVAEVGAIGLLTKVALHIPDVAVADVTGAEDITDQDAHARGGGAEGVAQAVVHIRQGDSDGLGVARRAVEVHQQVVRIGGINRDAAHRSTGAGRAIGASHVIIEGKHDRVSRQTAAAFNADVAGKRQIDVKVPLGAMGLSRGCAGQFQCTGRRIIEFRARERREEVTPSDEHLAVGQERRDM